MGKEILGQNLDESFDNSSQGNNTTVNESALGVQDMFGDDVRTKGKPLKGYRFLIFTVLMIIVLTTITYIDMEDLEQDSKHIAEEVKRAEDKKQDEA